jgi:hypothetical protein
MPLIPGGRAVKITALSQAVILRELYEGPISIAGLIAASGCGETTIVSYLKALRKLKLVRIGGWDVALNGAAVIPCFEWAPDKKDAPKPVKTAAERSRKSRALKKLKELHNALSVSI